RRIHDPVRRDRPAPGLFAQISHDRPRPRGRRRMNAPATNHLKALYGLKFNPFGPDVPDDALLCSPRVDDFGWRLEHGVAAEGGFALVNGGVGSGKSTTLRLLVSRLERQRDLSVAILQRPQSGVADFYREMGELFGVPLKPHNRWAGFRSLR